jgi:hypothetical protein
MHGTDSDGWSCKDCGARASEHCTKLGQHVEMVIWDLHQLDKQALGWGLHECYSK